MKKRKKISIYEGSVKRKSPLKREAEWGTVCDKYHLASKHKVKMYGYALDWWAIGDSNPGPTGYEPVALTN